MRVLHTSDWHLGRLLYGKKRHHEFGAFLAWLLTTVQEQHIELVLVAGDIFDTNTPGNQAQQMYYRFLAQLGQTDCRHVVVIGGNHDSPSFLDAPSALLKALNVHVIGEACADPADEVVVLEQDGDIEALVCAVPYLRERDLRLVEEGELVADKDAKLLKAIEAHYQATAKHAEALRGDADIPIIGMGHLFATGGTLLEGDGVRDLYVGSLGQVPASLFPTQFDYLALGHLHVAQTVAHQEFIRYCGSPVAMGFAEVGQQKQVLCIDFAGRSPSVTPIEVPTFQHKARLKGDLDTLLAELERLKSKPHSVWVEVDYSGTENIKDLRQRLSEQTEGSQVSILRVRNRQLRKQTLERTVSEETLAQLTPEQVFKRRLALEALPEPVEKRMLALHQEVLQSMQEEDAHANS